MPLRRILLLAMTALLPAVVGMNGCNTNFSTIAIDRPSRDLVVADGLLVVEARVAGVFDASTVEILLDGVDLIDGLGLTPPFQDVDAMLLVGADLVTIEDFRYDTGAAGAGKPVSARITGLSNGSHQLEIRGVKNGQVDPVVRIADVTLVTSLTLASEALVSHGFLSGAQSFGAEGEIPSVTLGQPFAAPPVTLSDGGEVRTGLQEAAEAHIAF